MQYKFTKNTESPWLILAISNFLFFSKLEGKVQELQSRLDAELDARDKISQTSHSVQNKINQLEKQVWDLTDELKKETDAHTKVSKSHSDLQKVQYFFFKAMNFWTC